MARGIAAGAWLLATVMMLIYGTATAWADFGQRYALVIGNSSYAQVEHLPNTASDAVAVADALEALRFNVFRGIDLDRERFERLIAEFRTASAEADAVVFYYAGHGFQLRGRNHLVPVDAVLRDRSKIDAETFVLDDIIERIRRPGRPTIVLLDACRDNPLPPGVQDGTGTGLAQLQTGDDTLIAFATQPGNVSYDGTTEHSPFTEALLTHIGAPQQTIFDLMINVRNEVSDRTLDRQVPWVQFSLRESFSFNPTPQSVARSELGELDGDQQGIVISRGVRDGRTDIADDPAKAESSQTEPSQAEPSATPAAPVTPAPPAPRFRFATKPEPSQQAGAPPEALPQPGQELPTLVTRQEEQTPPTTLQEPGAEQLAEDAEIGDADEVSPTATPPAAATAELPAAQEPEAADSDEPPAGARSAEPDLVPEDAREAEQQIAALPGTDNALAQPSADSEQEPTGKSETEQQIAALPRDELEPEPEPESPLVDGEELVRLIQQNLQRLGCYRLAVDGDWGPGSRSGLERFYRQTGQAAESLDPSPDVLARLEQESGEVCPPPKTQPKKTRTATPAKQPPARSTPQRQRQQPAPQPAPSQKLPPKLLF